jgi:hypothetical protein
MADVEDWARHALSSLRGIAYKAKTKPDCWFRDLFRCIDETLPSHGQKEAANNEMRVNGVHQGEPAYEYLIIAGILG